MSEETVYADLKFQDSEKKENINNFDRCGAKEPTAPPHLQHKSILILTLLCLLLFVGLGVLGGMFFTTLKREMVKLSKLQNTKEELQQNLSVQLMHNINSSKKVRSLSITLQKISTELCRKLYQKEPAHKCKPCPKTSMWYKDSCYSLLDGYENWQNGELLCSSQNASLLTIKNRSALEFVKSENLYNYWLGLSPRKEYINNVKVGDNIFSSVWSERSTSDLKKMYCGYINGMYVYYDYCTQRKLVMCEKAADKVKIESVLSKIPGETI
ncbi:C-type lectin domain family 12 member A [Nannospalax galili]|uniref:C-type lectin domain family 12 member A n=1 Tax=Nannospalax galili TaxID=1026970 RepID=UPI0004ED6D28|nr:C-type lectin domain family 12 member A [Nannospalax galili]